MGSIRGDVRVFVSGALLSYRALFRWFHPATYAASKVVMPLAQMAFFVLVGTFGGARPVQFYAIGNAMQVAAVSGIYGVTMSIAGDRWDGTLAYLFGSPVRRPLMFFGRAAIHILDGVIGVALAFGWAVLLFGLRLSGAQFASLLVAVIVTVFSTSGLGLMMGCIGLITRNVWFVNNTVYFLLLFLSGANVPLADLPGWLRPISSWLPLTHGIAAAREIATGSGLSAEALSLLAREAGVGLLYLLVGYLMFARFERRAKQQGSLETM